MDIRNRVVNERTITTFVDTITSANILEVEVGTNCPQGGDTGHGGRTYFRLTDLGGTDMVPYPELTDGLNNSISIEFGGDCELYTFIQALEFALKILKYQAKYEDEEGEAE